VGKPVINSQRGNCGETYNSTPINEDVRNQKRMNQKLSSPSPHHNQNRAATTTEIGKNDPLHSHCHNFENTSFDEMRIFVVAFLLLLSHDSVVYSFVPSFRNKDTAHCFGNRRPKQCFAANAPQYEKQDAVLERVEKVGKENFLLHVKSSIALDYEPGNVLALEIQQPSMDQDTINNDTDSETNAPFSVMNEKTQKGLQANNGWLRGPYTVSRCCDASRKEFQILIKRVGYKSNILATAPINTAVRFGGKFKVPIVKGIMDSIQINDTLTQRVVMISTGVGVGPCVGAIELLLQDAAFEGDVDLLASFRTREEVAMITDLEQLVQDHPSRFHWTPIITSQNGRIADSAQALEVYLKPKKSDNTCTVQSTHYHLIGNGQMVNEWRVGLEESGVPSERVTVEAYFNHMAQPNDATVQNIAKVVQKLAVTQPQTTLPLVQAR
jgi:ferredoxin-NADP reductase